MFYAIYKLQTSIIIIMINCITIYIKIIFIVFFNFDQCLDDDIFVNINVLYERHVTYVGTNK